MEQDTQVETTAAVEPTAPNLSIQDLLLAVRVIQSAAERGAFRAEELSNVGGLFDRLVAFLTASGALNQPQPEPAQDPAQGE